MNMNVSEFCDAIIANIKPFFEKNMEEPVFFQKRPTSQPGINAFPDVRIVSKDGKTILSFIIKLTETSNKPSNHSINIVIGDQKYLDIYNLFVKMCCVDGFESFSLFMDEIIKKNKTLKFIESYNIVQDHHSIQYESTLYGVIDCQTYAILKTPFETVELRHRPQFIFENNQFYLNPEFSFMTVVGYFNFYKRTECDDTFTKQSITKIANRIHKLYYYYVTTSISELYTIPVEEIQKWTPTLIMSYYPVLTMEMC